MKFFLSFFFICFLICHTSLCANRDSGDNHGDTVDGLPNYNSRSLICGLNWVRQDKVYFRENVLNDTSILGSNYPECDPVYLNPKIFTPAQNHAEWMASRRVLQAKGDGDSYPQDRVEAEGYEFSSLTWFGVAGGEWDGDSLEIVKYIMCGGSDSSNCVSDDEDPDMRNYVMDDGKSETGSGYAYNFWSSYKYHIDFKFAQPKTLFIKPEHPVASGSHFHEGSNIMYIMNYYEKAYPTRQPEWAYVAYRKEGSEEWESYPLESSGDSTYTYLKTRSATCDSYYFMVKTESGDIWRYPENQNLLTTDGVHNYGACSGDHYEESGCDASFDCGGLGACRSSEYCQCIKGYAGQSCDTCDDTHPNVDNAIEDRTGEPNTYFEFVFPEDSFVGDSLEFKATLEDGEPLPKWLEFLPDGRNFTGNTPDYCEGIYNISVTATNCRGEATDFFEIHIHSQNPSVENNVPDQNANSATASWEYEIPEDTFSDPHNQQLDYTLEEASGGDLPDWLTFDKKTMIISGDTPDGCGETIDFKIIATNECGFTNSDIFELEITNEAPTVKRSLDDQSIIKNEELDYTFLAECFHDRENEDLTYTAVEQSQTTLPSWVSFDPDQRRFTGTAPDAETGQWIIEVTATDSCSSNTKSTTFEIQIDNSAPSKAYEIDDQEALATQYYDFIFDVDTFTGGSLTYTAEQSDGTDLPDWLEFVDADRNFKGQVPDGCGTHIDLKVTAQNSQGSASESFGMDVVNDPISKNQDLADQEVHIKSEYEYIFNSTVFTDPEEGTITYTATLDDGSSLPDWLEFDAAERKFSGTAPNECGDPLTIKVTAKDSCEDNDASGKFVLTLNDYPVQVIGENPDTRITGNTQLDYKFDKTVFQDYDDLPLEYTAEQKTGEDLPSWMDFDSETGEFTGLAPVKADFFIIKVIATDTCGNTAEDIFNINIQKGSEDDDDDIVSSANHLLFSIISFFACLLLFAF
ncbi:dystroglycan-related [Anaeramoeba flamelloides]|uniref:Dystroglycan-related n=1 Tax=Anaeramoeba flamelloides TaxID=1746091 RepID=A0AAV8A9U9_9EUKA|nr:dystroglycan-related [Anaeramoeba flamelloides]